VIRACVTCKKVYGIKRPYFSLLITSGFCQKCLKIKLAELRKFKNKNIKTNREGALWITGKKESKNSSLSGM